MKKIFLSLLGSLTLVSVKAQPTTWKVDASHSNVKFTVTHMVVSEMDGAFKTYDGSLVTENADFSNASINFTVDVASINTESVDRDAHLKGDDFFNAEKYPKMTFKSTSFKKVGDKKYELEGNLTIRNITKKVKFNVTGGGTVVDPWGNTKTGFKAVTTINRIQYDLKWNKAIEAGGWVVGEEVTIALNIEMNKEK
jgi:polyisoprenoid-binding protein YceI